MGFIGYQEPRVGSRVLALLGPTMGQLRCYVLSSPPAPERNNGCLGADWTFELSVGIQY